MALLQIFPLGSPIFFLLLLCIPTWYMELIATEVFVIQRVFFLFKKFGCDCGGHRGTVTNSMILALESLNTTLY